MMPTQSFRVVERRADRPGLAPAKRRHRVEEMGEAGQARVPRAASRSRSSPSEWPADDDDPALASRAISRRPARAPAPASINVRAAAERGDQRDVLLVHLADEAGVVDALALRVEERPLDVDAEHAGDARPLAPRAVAAIASAMCSRRVGDDGRQEAGRAEAPVRRADRRDPLDACASSLNSTPPPPFTCTSMKPGASSPPLDGADGRLRRALAVRHQRGDPAVVDDDAWPSTKRVAVEDPGAGQRNAHHRVSVTFLRCGGRSGSRPRVRASASASR